MSKFSEALPFFIYVVGSLAFAIGSLICIYRIYK
jgi:hypothetical protein